MRLLTLVVLLAVAIAGGWWLLSVQASAVGGPVSMGDVAHDAADSGNPLKVGMKAIDYGTNPTGVAANDRTDWYANRAGIPFVAGGHPNIITLEFVWTTAKTDAAIVTVSSSAKIAVTELEAVCDNANTVDVAVRVGFGSSTLPTLPTDGNTATSMLMSHPGIAAGSGVIRGSGAGVLGVGAADADLRITAEVPTTGSCRLIVSYFTIEG